MTWFAAVAATDDERREPRAGDALLGHADVVMDRAFTVAQDPEKVWPWVVQLGKGRAGWYLPKRVESFLPVTRRATRRIDTRWQALRVDDVIPDYGGRNETFTVAEIDPPLALVYTSQRRGTGVTWSITLKPLPLTPGLPHPRTRVLLRLRLAPVRHVWLARTAGDWFDALTIAGLAAGLRERA